MTPRVYPPRRAHVGFRVDKEKVAQITELAEREGVAFSEMLRRLVEEALTARAATTR